MSSTAKKELIERILIAFDDPAISQEKNQKLKELYREINALHDNNVTAEHVNMVNAILG